MSVIEKMSSIPNGIQTSHLREVQSDVEPMIRLDGKTLFIPIFVRQGEATDEQGNVHTSYRYFEAPAAYVGQDMADYSKCCLQSYADIRAYLYGDWKTQNEQILKSTFTAHQYAVRDRDADPFFARQSRPVRARPRLLRGVREFPRRAHETLPHDPARRL